MTFNIDVRVEGVRWRLCKFLYVKLLVAVFKQCSFLMLISTWYKPVRTRGQPRKRRLCTLEILTCFTFHRSKEPHASSELRAPSGKSLRLLPVCICGVCMSSQIRANISNPILSLFSFGLGGLSLCPCRITVIYSEFWWVLVSSGGF